jgi:hypothetical protein
MPDGGIDVSMYRPPAVANPLGVVGEFARAQNQLNQARTFQMEFAARQALGPMMKASIQPDGTLDQAKLFQLVAAHPATGWKLPELVQGLLQNQLTTETIAKTHLENAKGHFGNMADMATSILANAKREGREWVTPQEYTEGMQRGIGMGLYKPSDLMALYKGDPDVIGPGPQPAKGSPEELARNKRIYNKVFSMANASSKANETVQNTLGYLAPTARMGWEAAMQPQTTQDITGRETTGPRGLMPGFSQGFGPNPLAGTSPPGVGGGPAPGLVPPSAPPGPEPAATPPPGPVPGPAPATAAPAPGPAVAPVAGAAAPTPGVMTKRPPAVGDAEKGFDEYRQALDAQAVQARQTKIVIPQLEQALGKIKGGGGTTTAIAIARLAQALGAHTVDIDRLAGGSLPAGQVAQKFLIQQAVNDMKQRLLSTAGGGGSAGRLAVAEFTTFIDKANPTLDMDPRAVREMLKYQMKLADMALKEQAHVNRIHSDWLGEGPHHGMLPSGKGGAYEPGLLSGIPTLINRKLQESGALAPFKSEL